MVMVIWKKQNKQKYINHVFLMIKKDFVCVYKNWLLEKEKKDYIQSG